MSTKWTVKFTVCRTVPLEGTDIDPDLHPLAYFSKVNSKGVETTRELTQYKLGKDENTKFSFILNEKKESAQVNKFTENLYQKTSL